MGIEKVVHTIAVYATATNSNFPLPSFFGLAILFASHHVVMGGFCFAPRVLSLGPACCTAICDRVHKKPMGPTVSFIVVLVLSVSPCLSWERVLYLPLAVHALEG